jgi:hypothetical protein
MTWLAAFSDLVRILVISASENKPGRSIQDRRLTELS